MSMIEVEDPKATGYFLPEETQLRLKKLHEYATFLANLARPRQSDPSLEGFAEIRPGEVGICLEHFEEQIGGVLDEIGWPALLIKEATATDADAPPAHKSKEEAETAIKATATQTGQSAAAVTSPRGYTATLDQVDQMNLLLASLHAVGNVVACADHAELSDATLSIMGDAIYRDVAALRKIVDDIYYLAPESDDTSSTEVQEAHASYLALPKHAPTANTSCLMQEHPTYQ
ncbi:hypothetical protein [Oleiagrimonas sp. C23AA]|uniref:XAC0095 family protein n=1 Tax=Oleiagrimonas sp. C23AA TaxID=2719047 RepID=UPI0014221159|nr:hypothetical protein [Oleiagrimonas sp. C23AA]NII11743.1 hypothetical protein [Oleiagrimonas sp. C23AA]